MSRMVIERDLQSAKYAFHICKQFAKYAKMHPTVMLKKNEIVNFIMICLKDQSLKVLDKREALQLTSFMLAD